MMLRKLNKQQLDFSKKAEAEMQEYMPTEIMNTDQVGLEKELHSTRTLSYQV